MTKCYLCGKAELQKKKAPYTLHGEFVGHFDAEVCESCHEVFFDEETSREITKATKAKGLWGLDTRTKIAQAGSTLDIRLPKRIIEFLHLKKGEEITIHPESRRKLIIEL